MHNCKRSKDELIEAASPWWIPLPDELRNCPRCYEELASLRAAMQITDEAMQLVKPGEDFWAGYHARLRQRLETESESPVRSLPDPASGSSLSWRRLFTASIPVPIPVAFAVFAFVVFAVGFVWHARAAANTAPAPPASVVTRTVEVPVVQERVVTRVVYRERRNASDQLARRLKSSPRAEFSGTAEGLAGFTPAPEPKLTIIKASYRDEK